MAEAPGGHPSARGRGAPGGAAPPGAPGRARLHLVKLSVGSESLESLRRFSAARLAAEGRCRHDTRAFPRRAAELLEGGSIFWVVQGLIQGRQRLTGIERVRRPDGSPGARLLLAPEVAAVEPRARRAFQGWRYLEPEDAPPDLEDGGDGLPAETARELRALGLL